MSIKVQGLLYPRNLPVPEGLEGALMHVSTSLKPHRLSFRSIIVRSFYFIAANENQWLFFPPRCDSGYSGERCHLFYLELKTSGEAYDRTTALAVVAVVLSTLCLTIIGLLLALRFVFTPSFVSIRKWMRAVRFITMSVFLSSRFHKQGAYNVENEEKVKLGAAPHH